MQCRVRAPFRAFRAARARKPPQQLYFRVFARHLPLQLHRQKQSFIAFDCALAGTFSTTCRLSRIFVRRGAVVLRMRGAANISTAVPLPPQLWRCFSANCFCRRKVRYAKINTAKINNMEPHRKIAGCASTRPPVQQAAKMS
jgi:hypothetical protein